MNSEPSKLKNPPNSSPDTEKSGKGTEVEKQGGVEPAKRQAERDWQESAKESGD